MPVRVGALSVRHAEGRRAEAVVGELPRPGRRRHTRVGARPLDGRCTLLLPRPDLRLLARAGTQDRDRLPRQRGEGHDRQRPGRPAERGRPLRLRLHRLRRLGVTGPGLAVPQRPIRRHDEELHGADRQGCGAVVESVPVDPNIEEGRRRAWDPRRLGCGRVAARRQRFGQDAACCRSLPTAISTTATGHRRARRTSRASGSSWARTAISASAFGEKNKAGATYLGWLRGSPDPGGPEEVPTSWHPPSPIVTGSARRLKGTADPSGRKIRQLTMVAAAESVKSQSPDDPMSRDTPKAGSADHSLPPPRKNTAFKLGSSRRPNHRGTAPAQSQPG